MTGARRDALLRTAIVVGYFARPWSCGIAAGNDPPKDGDPYHTIDPHGFATMAAWGGALLLAAPVLWLLLQRRTRAGVEPGFAWRGVVALAVLGGPTVFQWSFAHLPLAIGWPVIASAAVWLALVAAAALNTGTTGPSLHGTFDRHPAIAWGLLLAIGALKVTFLAYALAG